jgi:hypothetical protein
MPQPAGNCDGAGCWHLVHDVQQVDRGAEALLLLTERQPFVQIDWTSPALLLLVWVFEARPDASSVLKMWAASAGLVSGPLNLHAVHPELNPVPLHHHGTQQHSAPPASALPAAPGLVPSGQHQF